MCLLLLLANIGDFFTRMHVNIKFDIAHYFEQHGLVSTCQRQKINIISLMWQKLVKTHFITLSEFLLTVLNSYMHDNQNKQQNIVDNHS